MKTLVSSAAEDAVELQLLTHWGEDPSRVRSARRGVDNVAFAGNYGTSSYSAKSGEAPGAPETHSRHYATDRAADAINSKGTE